MSRHQAEPPPNHDDGGRGGRSREHTFPLWSSVGPAGAVRSRTPWSRLSSIGVRAWIDGAAAAVASVVLIAVPTRLIPNPWFSRMTPTRPQDYLFLAISSSLVGASVAVARHAARANRSAVVGGFGTFIAVGCPVCNKLVITFLGTGAALSWFAPLQPVIAAASIGLVFAGFRRSVRAMEQPACVVAS